MIKTESNYTKFLLIFISLIAFIAFTFAKEIEKNGKDRRVLKKTSLTAGDAYRLQVNKLDISLNNRGVLADVDIGGLDGGYFDGKQFLFSGGFFLTGYYNGVLFGNAVASASRIEDYNAGTIDGKSNTIYIVKSSDDPFGESWMEWKAAVEAGACFYDGDNDGLYDPVDKNGNLHWDTDEDKPDILGDETVWCVFNDGVKSSDRREGYKGNIPLGIEIRQTVWGYATSGDLGGESGVSDDLIGCDVALKTGYTYNDGPDPVFGADPPAFMIGFFPGPWEYTGNNADTAYNRKGVFLGIDTIVGARNLPLTSFVQYIQSNPIQGDPDNTQEMRNYTLGKSMLGTVVDPCNWHYGTVLSERCLATAKKYAASLKNPQGYIDDYKALEMDPSRFGPPRLIKLGLKVNLSNIQL